MSDFGWPDGYELRAPGIQAASWREIFSSDAPQYDGDGVSNRGQIEAEKGLMTLRLPARGFVVLRQVPVS